MATTDELYVVLGATGGVGGALTRELAARGARVRAVSRGGRLPQGLGAHEGMIEACAADIARVDDARIATEGAAVVYFCANPPYDRWARDFPTLLAGAIAGASAADAKFIFADNLYMYPPTSAPMTEETPWQPVTRKGAVRKQLDETLLEAHRTGQVRAVIGRASDYYGPAAPNTALGDRLFKQLLAGKSVQWIGKLDTPHTFSYVEDIARGLLTLGERDEALGQVWHIPAAEPLTGREFITLAAQEAGIAPKMSPVPPVMLRALGLFNPIIGELVEMQYEFDAPYIMDTARFTRVFGAAASAPTPHREALRDTITWYRASQTVA